MGVIGRFWDLPRPRRARLALFPVVLLIEMPVAWTRSLWAARTLLDGQWDRYMGFQPYNALNSFFYRTQWFNINRYGRNGTSPVAGLGDYPLSRWFHLSLPASYVYAYAGAVTTLGGTLAWVFLHLLWMGTADIWWVSLLILALLLSTTAYAMAFARQNYQILGWMWLPVALFGVLNEHWIIAGLAWMAASLGGITPIFFAVPISIALAYMQTSVLPVLVLTPALIKAASHLVPRAGTGSLGTAVWNTAKLIGATSTKVRYRRTSMKLGSFNRYFVLLYGLATVGMWFLRGDLPLLLLLGWALFVINQLFVRVADDQSMAVIFVSLLVAVLASGSPSVWGLSILWLTAAVPPHLFHLADKGARVQPLGPFDHAMIEQDLRTFFSHVRPGERVLMGFSDPEGQYENLFDGYRALLELPVYVATQKGVHLMPDWYCVAETNYEGAPSVWGRSPADVKRNLEQWEAEYSIVYQEEGGVLGPEWGEEFVCRGVIDWSKYVASFRGSPPWAEGRVAPRWFLLERSANNA